MKNHTLTAALDLLFELQRCKDEADKINEAIWKLNTGDDFSARISPCIGHIEQRIADMLDLYLEEVTGCESLAEHMLYETGKVTHGQHTYNLKHRAEFEDFIKKVTS